MYPFITLPVHFDYFIPTNHLYLPVLSPVVLSIRRFTLSSANWFHLCVFVTWLYTHTYLSTQIWMYLLILAMICSKTLPIHSELPTWSTRPPNYCSIYIQIYSEIICLFVMMLSFQLTTKTYLLTKVLLHMAIDASALQPIRSFWYFNFD